MSGSQNKSPELLHGYLGSSYIKTIVDPHLVSQFFTDSPLLRSHLKLAGWNPHKFKSRPIGVKSQRFLIRGQSGDLLTTQRSGLCSLACGNSIFDS
jgi:hypothetical protein